MTPSHPSLQPLAARYRARLLRALELALARSELALPPQARLLPFDDAALRQASGWRAGGDGRAGWDWPAVAAHYTRTDPKAFQAALWHGGTLCGMAVGRVRTRKAVGIHYIEGAPGLHPLRGLVFPVMLVAADFYRIQIGAPELRLYAVAPALVGMYERAGFRLAPELGNPHHMRRGAP